MQAVIKLDTSALDRSLGRFHAEFLQHFRIIFYRRLEKELLPILKARTPARTGGIKKGWHMSLKQAGNRMTIDVRNRKFYARPARFQRLRPGAGFNVHDLAKREIRRILSGVVAYAAREAFRRTRV